MRAHLGYGQTRKEFRSVWDFRLCRWFSENGQTGGRDVRLCGRYILCVRKQAAPYQSLSVIYSEVIYCLKCFEYYILPVISAKGHNHASWEKRIEFAGLRTICIACKTDSENFFLQGYNEEGSQIFSQKSYHTIYVIGQ